MAQKNYLSFIWSDIKKDWPVAQRCSCFPRSYLRSALLQTVHIILWCLPGAQAPPLNFHYLADVDSHYLKHVNIFIPCVTQRTVRGQTLESPSVLLTKTRPAGVLRRSFGSLKMLTPRPWDRMPTRSENMWVHLTLSWSTIVELKLMEALLVFSIWTSGRETPWKAEGVKLKICYETAVAIFIHLLIPCGPEYKSADMKAKWILLQHF